VAYLADGWQPLERQDGAAIRWRWMGERAEVRLYNPLEHPVPVRLTLHAAAYRHERPLRIALDATPLGTLNIPPDAPTGYTLNFFLPPGEHTLHVQSDAAPSEGRAEPISVRMFAVRFEF
jgi:hypothetical protein